MMVDFPPGVAQEASRRRNKTNWREANLVRWEDGTLRPIGGWAQVGYGASPFASPCRAMHRWITNDGLAVIAFLCEQHCYVDIGDGELVDITPIDGIAPPTTAGAGGYGDGVYGTDLYGEPRDAQNRLDVATPAYTLDNWGEELRAMTSSDGRFLGWVPGGVDPLAAVAGAPVSNRTFAITPERHVILFGAGGVSQEFKWSDEEDDTEWTVGTTTKAGGFFIQPAAPIMARFLTPAGTLMWTSNWSFIVRYVGLPYVYGYDKITESPPPISPAAVAATPDGAIWLAVSGFWKFNGVSCAPMFCPIWDWIEKNMNILQTRYFAAAIHVAPQSEVWFCFAAGESPEANTHVAIYNYKYDIWTMGEVSRQCGVSSANDPNPVMSDGVKVYLHEDGYVYSGADMPWVESHTFNLNNGTTMATVKQLLPEVGDNADAIQFKFYKRQNPSANGSESLSVAKTIRSNGYVDVRETARDFRLRVEMVAAKAWSLGPIDVNPAQRGQK